MSGPSDAPARARIGRPRAVAKEITGDVAEEILGVAARLFSTVGYSATTTRQIADAVGLKQGSLFHYFSRKEDMLAELLDRTVEPALAFVDHVAELDAPADLKLFTLVLRDTRNLCSGEVNLGALLRLPEARAERFDAYWARRDSLRNGYGTLIADGVATGLVHATNPSLARDLIFGLVESVIDWYERGVGRQPDEVAIAVAWTALRALRVPEPRIAELQTRVGEQAPLPDRPTGKRSWPTNGVVPPPKPA